VGVHWLSVVRGEAGDRQLERERLRTGRARRAAPGAGEQARASQRPTAGSAREPPGDSLALQVGDMELACCVCG
jgi:hypothetical protein